jgi:hypothetical protein
MSEEIVCKDLAASRNGHFVRINLGLASQATTYRASGTKYRNFKTHALSYQERCKIL